MSIGGMSRAYHLSMYGNTNGQYRPPIIFNTSAPATNVNLTVQDFGCGCGYGYYEPRMTSMQKWTLGLGIGNAVLSGILDGVRSNRTDGSTSTDDSAAQTRFKGNLDTLANKFNGIVLDEGNGRYSVYDENNNVIADHATYIDAQKACNGHLKSKNLPHINKDARIATSDNQTAVGVDNESVTIGDNTYKRTEENGTAYYINTKDPNDKYELTNTNGNLKLIIRPQPTGSQQNTPANSKTEVKDILNENITSIKCGNETWQVNINSEKKEITIDGVSYKINTESNSQYITDPEGTVKYKLFKNGDTYEMSEIKN